MHASATWNAEREAYGERLYERLVSPFRFGTFWPLGEPLGGDCVEVAFEDGEPPLPDATPPFSDGRLQAYARRRAAACADFRVSMLFGERDWVDSRVAIDIAREFPCVNAASGGRVLRLPNAGHQLFVDNPAAFARAVITCAGPALSRSVPEEWRDPLGSSARS